MQTIPVGEMCLYYRQGDKNTLPMPAVVTKTSPIGLLALTCWPHNAVSPCCVVGVRYCDDPYLQNHEEVKLECGTWDYVEGREPRTPAPQQMAKPMPKKPEPVQV